MSKVKEEAERYIEIIEHLPMSAKDAYTALSLKQSQRVSILAEALERLSKADPYDCHWIAVHASEALKKAEEVE